MISIATISTSAFVLNYLNTILHNIKEARIVFMQEAFRNMRWGYQKQGLLRA